MFVALLLSPTYRYIGVDIRHKGDDFLGINVSIHPCDFQERIK